MGVVTPFSFTATSCFITITRRLRLGSALPASPSSHRLSPSCRCPAALGLCSLIRGELLRVTDLLRSFAAWLTRMPRTSVRLVGLSYLGRLSLCHGLCSSRRLFIGLCTVLKVTRLLPLPKFVFLHVYMIMSKMYLNGGFDNSFYVIFGLSISPENMSEVGFQ